MDPSPSKTLQGTSQWAFIMIDELHTHDDLTKITMPRCESQHVLWMGGLLFAADFQGENVLKNR
jgi:hypothetical protein